MLRPPRGREVGGGDRGGALGWGVARGSDHLLTGRTVGSSDMLLPSMDLLCVQPRLGRGCERNEAT